MGLLGADLVDPSVTPAFPTTLPAGTAAVLEADIRDESGISSAVLLLERDGQLPQAFVMQPLGASRWSAAIPPQTAGASVASVRATDGAGRTASSEPAGILFLESATTDPLQAGGGAAPTESPADATLLPLPLPGDQTGDGDDEGSTGSGGSGSEGLPGGGGSSLLPGSGGGSAPASGGSADRTPPRFTLLLPAPGSETGEPRPALRVSYQDDTGIDVASATLMLDGAPLRPAATAAGAVAMLYRDLAPGEHHVEASVEDAAGNVARADWRFRVTDAGAPDALVGGSLVRVELDGVPADALRLSPIRFAGGEERRPVVAPLVDARAFPEGSRALAAFELEPEAPGTGAATLELHVSEAWLESSGAEASRLVLLHHVDGSWRPHLLENVGAAEGTLTLVTAVPSFSPFALAVDDAPPVLRLGEPLAGLRAGDVAVARVLLHDASGAAPGALLLDGVPLPGVSRSAERMVSAIGPLDAGTHTLSAVATDAFGSKTQETWTFVVAAADEAASAAGFAPASPSPDGAPAQDGSTAGDATRESIGQALLGSLFVGLVGLAGLARALSKGREPPKRRL